MEPESIDWVLCYLLYLFVASFQILMYAKMTGQGFLAPHITNNIHSQDQESTHDSKSYELDNGLS
jgi:hypothetical protein